MTLLNHSALEISDSLSLARSLALSNISFLTQLSCNFKNRKPHDEAGIRHPEECTFFCLKFKFRRQNIMNNISLPKTHSFYGNSLSYSLTLSLSRLSLSIGAC